MNEPLQGRRVAALVTDGFEQVELTSPRDALQEAGATVAVTAPGDAQVRGWDGDDWGHVFTVDADCSDGARPEDFDALLLPGGVMNPDALRIDEDALAFVRHFVTAGKPIAAICHGPWTLVELDAVRGRTLTSYPAIRTDLANAGANWVDEEVVTDGQLLTSRSPDDLPAFNEAIVRHFT